MPQPRQGGANRPSLDDYVDVAERVAAFIERHPEGSLRRISWEIQTVGEQTFIVYTAAAFRHPEDPAPGIGTAWEPFPGRTPYTKDSELMNAETAAWGRAIVAVGLASNRKIASRQEVAARQAQEREAQKAAMTDRAKELLAEADGLYAQVGESRLPLARFDAYKNSTGYTEDGLQRLVDWLREQVPEGAPA